MGRMKNYSIWVTTDCNLRCTYCYEGQNKKQTYIDRNVADKIIDFIVDQEKSDTEELSIDFHGGEPFLNFRILEYFVDNLNSRLNKKIYYGLTTNAIIMNEDIIKFLEEKIDDITVSLDGTSKTHNTTRCFLNGEGSYDIAMNNSLKILKISNNLRVRMTITAKTVQSLSEDVLHLLNKGFKCIVPIVDLFGKDWTDEKLDVLKDEIEKIKNIELPKDCCVSLLEPIHINCIHQCYGGINEASIYSDGKIYPCIMTAGKKEFEIGDIYHGIDINKRNALLQHNKEQYYECVNCDLQNGCDGKRCKMINKIITGSFIVPPALTCELQHITYLENGLDV